ncbi:sensor histidine kinase [Sphaerisporangium krabiense]|uniref:histidine kinase n=1 Tax=Sphaerisporangium krabiense TaxID=763782 RepID=A0A7W8Z748_9ACTN|nr:ATP-binding protein [Sphaerisporangium krabiense]MBB5628709.1 signal transduction histidine kinase [Sphaerisporangium krabiense]GII60451.1 sensor histidine kinase [Sphaerisporangium krabiense]
MTRDLITVVLEDDHAVFAVRQVGRDVAEAVGLDELDRIRVGTALSEVGREIVAGGRQATISFRLDDGVGLVLDLSYSEGPRKVAAAGVLLAGRLMDTVDHDDGTRRITMVKRVPGSRDLAEGALGEIRARQGELTPAGVLDELRQQNRELASALEDSQRQRQNLLRLNAELEETNQGVLALYNQLSEELEETNRGVVALYAELDEKSAQLREASEARNRFWATISHELRTPLNSVIGLVRLLLGPGGEELSQEQQLQVELIGSSAQTLLALVAELLDMAKAESGRLTPQPAAVDVPALADRLSMTLDPTSADRVRLTVDVRRAPRTLTTDEVLLSRVLRNLMSNALKFTESGEVSLTAYTDGGEVVFVVADTGIGIPDELQQRVFEEFFQIPGPVQTRARGTGLGLPYARRLTEALGGTLQLTSVPGEGTTVTVRLPLTPVTDNPQTG